MKIFTYRGTEPSLKYGTVDPQSVMFLLHRQLDLLEELAHIVMLVPEETVVRDVSVPVPKPEEKK